MTSSLVGSEMCIRDRIKQAFSGHPPDQVPVPVASRFGPFSRCSLCGCRSVSYTHLTLPTICSV
eukprot:4397596-Prorocentrum_lima.AAC.1